MDSTTIQQWTQWTANIINTTCLLQQDSLCLLDEIGEGAFGKVFKGQLSAGSRSNVDVAVKILKDDVSRQTREDFEREVKIVSSFDHENILRLIGVVVVDSHSPYMVFEYMEYGDLAALLQANDICSGVTPRVKISQSDQVDMAAQIAAGQGLVVKIADFGMSRDVYTCDYYKLGSNRMLPVRWMSLETIRYGRCTTESDVWAFGVVLWEIFANGKQPYYGHTNEEVIQFLEDGILLQQPTGCPEDIYHVMLGCWRHDPRERFSFDRIHRHLAELCIKVVVSDTVSGVNITTTTRRTALEGTGLAPFTPATSRTPRFTDNSTSGQPTHQTMQTVETSNM